MPRAKQATQPMVQNWGAQRQLACSSAAAVTAEASRTAVTAPTALADSPRRVRRQLQLWTCTPESIGAWAKAAGGEVPLARTSAQAQPHGLMHLAAVSRPLPPPWCRPARWRAARANLAEAIVGLAVRERLHPWRTCCERSCRLRSAPSPPDAAPSTGSSKAVGHWARRAATVLWRARRGAPFAGRWVRPGG